MIATAQLLKQRMKGRRVIANLSVWFALHVLFSRVLEQSIGRLILTLPDMSSFDWRAAVLALTATILIFRLKWNIMPVLGVSASGGLLLSYAI